MGKSIGKGCLRKAEWLTDEQTRPEICQQNTIKQSKQTFQK